MITYIMDKYKRIDILINNAGITKDGLIMRMKEEDFDRVIDVNLKGTFNCIRHVSRYMLKQRSETFVISVSIYPGATALTVIPRDASSFAADLVIPITPALEAL